jgi:hypothetical protein
MVFFPVNVALQATMIHNWVPVCLDSGKYTAFDVGRSMFDIQSVRCSSFIGLAMRPVLVVNTTLFDRTTLIRSG